MKPVPVKVARVHPSAKMPVRSTERAGAYDVFPVKVEQKIGIDKYDTGLKFEFPDTHVMLVFPRSSVSKTNSMLANGVGVIDADYRGNLYIAMRKMAVPGDAQGDLVAFFNPQPCYEPKGDRAIAQIMFVEIPSAEFMEVSEEELSDTSRGEQGFGSTDKI